MPVWPRVVSLYRTVFRSAQLDRDLDDELQSAVQELTARRVRTGMPEDAARREAAIELGGVQQTKEWARDVRVGSSLESLGLDVRLALRSLGRAPGFSAAVILTLALGIGANTAIFSVVNAILLSPLPYRDADRLAFVWADLTQAGYPRAPMAGPEYKDLRERSTLFDNLGGIWSNTAALTGDGDPEQLRIGLVTINFFSVLGAEAALGRTFAPEDETPTSPPVILLSWDLWQRRYGGNAAVVGSRVPVNGSPTTVVGVMPKAFRLWMPADANVPDDLQAWRPLSPAFTRWARGQQFLRIVGRMRPGVTIEQASREVAAIGRRIGTEYTEYGTDPPSFYAVGLHADGTREIRPALLTLFGGVTILLLIACVNVANLLIARSAVLQTQTALRAALGASRLRLVRHCVLEGVLLALLGGAAGVAVAAAGVQVLVALRPEGLNRLATTTIDLRVLAFTALTSIGWGLALSLAPAARVLRADVLSVLRPGTRIAGSRFDYRMRGGLLLLQISLSVILLVSAGLLVRAFVNLQRIDVGFSAEHALTFRIAPPGGRYRPPAGLNTFWRRLEDELRRLPGVTGVGAVSHLPYDNLPNWSTPYVREGAADASGAREADTRAITPGYFDAVRATLVDGRPFTDDDQAGAQVVAIVDERLAARTWPGERVVGKRFLGDPYTTGSARTLVTVVGVVRHLRHRSPAAEVREQIYVPERQAFRNPMAFVVRSQGDPASLAAPIRQIVGAIDGQLPVYDVRPLDDYLHRARAVPRFSMLLAGAFAAVALMLACIGVYGVLAYSVARRRQEFGVRLALGADPGRILRLVMREAALLGATGIVIGIVGSIAASGFLQTQLYGVVRSDPVAYGVALIVIILAIGAASIVPASRATRVNAIEALRVE